MTFLQTERLVLRQVRPEDAKIVYAYRNQPSCLRFQRGQVRDLEGIRALLQASSRDTLGIERNAMVAVALRDTDEMIGEIVVMPSEGAISFGYTFSQSHHRKGYAYEALSSLANHLHEAFPEWEFISFTNPQNAASMGLLKKLGYRDLGYIQKLDSQAFGKWVKEEPLH